MLWHRCARGDRSADHPDSRSRHRVRNRRSGRTGDTCSSCVGGPTTRPPGAPPPRPSRPRATDGWRPGYAVPARHASRRATPCATGAASQSRTTRSIWRTPRGWGRRSPSRPHRSCRLRSHAVGHLESDGLVRREHLQWENPHAVAGPIISNLNSGVDLVRCFDAGGRARLAPCPAQDGRRPAPRNGRPPGSAVPGHPRCRRHKAAAPARRCCPAIRTAAPALCPSARCRRGAA